MAFSTLDSIRTGGLNLELGLESDTDNSFGTTAQRNFYLQRAFQKLWPEMALLTTEDIVIVQDDTTYTPTLADVERIALIDAAGMEADEIKSWDLFADRAADPVVYRLTIPRSTAGVTMRLYGYKPYIVPASGGAACDLAPRLEFVVCAGARVEAYRAKLNSYANFRNFQNENRINAISAAELLDLMRSAERDFNQYRLDNRREWSAPKRAIRSVR